VNIYAGDTKEAITELNRLVAGVDAMGAPGALAVKIAALSDVAVIAIHTRDFATAEQALKLRTPLLLQQATEVGSAAFQRGAEANVAFDRWLAARKGTTPRPNRQPTVWPLSWRWTRTRVSWSRCTN
jgi:hypothetical protein